MKSFKMLSRILTFTASTVLVSFTAHGQEVAARRTDTAPAARKAQLDKKTIGRGLRASKLIGMNLENSQEENVGEISDIVLNSVTGEVQYVAVTYGGILGVGNEMHAVPFEAIKVKRDPDSPNDPDSLVLVLDVTKEQLSDDAGFDEGSWPRFGDPTFIEGWYRRYRVKRRMDRRRGRDIEVQVDRDGIEVDVDAK